jgi:hypothetical protein
MDQPLDQSQFRRMGACENPLKARWLQSEHALE